MAAPRDDATSRASSREAARSAADRTRSVFSGFEGEGASIVPLYRSAIQGCQTGLIQLSPRLLLKGVDPGRRMGQYGVIIESKQMTSSERQLAPAGPGDSLRDRRMIDRRALSRRTGRPASSRAEDQSSSRPMPLWSPESALPQEDELWEVAHVAQFLKRSESWVYKKTALGVLPVRRLDGWGLRYVPGEIRKWAGEAN